jgi:lysophospholipase L1-like esterase
MRARGFILALATAFAAAPPAVGAQAPAGQVRSTATTSARPAPGTAATIAGGDTTVVAWAQRSAAGQRVFAWAGAPDELTILGPRGAGEDGAPVSAAPGDGSVWVVSSRGRGAGQRLWMQRWADGSWQAPADGPSARAYDHHPALAVDPSSKRIWATWLGEDGIDRNSAMLYASSWTGAGWSPAEPLPRSVGAPMAPSIAVDVSGTPYVVWAASDGTDAEIWVSSRRGGRWTSPTPVTRNQVPDITPSVAATATGVLLTWISYTDEGYLPAARTGADIDDWDDPYVLDTSPGGRPLAIAIDGRPAVVWRRLAPGPAGGTITSRVRDAEGWSAPVDVVAASGSPFTVTRAPAGDLMLAFSRPDGRLGVVESEAVTRRDRFEGLAAASATRFGDPSVVQPAPTPVTGADEEPLQSLPLPSTYTAFGDSITNGVLYDPDRQDSPGYREPLQLMLRAFFGFGTVFNAGVDGETTADGVGRIDNSIQAQNPDVILIMEGTNDIVNVIDIDVSAFNLRRMVQRSYEERPDIIPFLAQIPPRLDPGPDGFDGPGNGRIDDLNLMIAEIGPEEGAAVADMNTPIDGHPELMSNPLHPSAAGYEVMAEAWYEVVQPGVLELTNQGDIDRSGRADGLDLVQLALAFGSLLGEPRYTLAADINGDGIIDGFDLDILIEFFGQQVSTSGGSGS